MKSLLIALALTLIPPVIASARAEDYNETIHISQLRARQAREARLEKRRAAAGSTRRYNHHSRTQYSPREDVFIVRNGNAVFWVRVPK